MIHTVRNTFQEVCHTLDRAHEHATIPTARIRTRARQWGAVYGAAGMAVRADERRARLLRRCSGLDP